MFKILLLFIMIQSILLSQTLSFEKSYAHALKYSPAIQSKLHKMKAEIAKEKQSFASLNPNVSFSANHNEYFNSKTSLDQYENNPSSFRSSQATFTIRQVLYNEPITKEYEKSKIAISIAKLEYDKEKQDLMVDVAQNYYDLLHAKKKHLLYQKKQKTLFEQKKDIEKRFELKEATIQDLSTIRAEYYVTQSDTIEAFLKIKKLQSTLQSLTQLPINDNTQLIELDMDIIKDIKVDTKLLEKEIIEHNIKYKIKKLKLLLSQKNIQSSKSDIYPTLDLVINSTHYDTDKSISDDKYYSRQNYVALELKAQLYEGGKSHEKVIEAKQTKLQEKQEIKALEQELYNKMINEYLNMKSTYNQITTLQFSKQAAQQTLTAIEVGFSMGTKTNLDVLDAIEKLYTIQDNILEIKNNYIISKLNLQILRNNFKGD